MGFKSNPSSAGAAIYNLAVDAKRRLPERRSEVRLPFFREASIDMDDGHQLSAFTRDISNLGIGLLHNLGVAPGEFDIRISSDQGRRVRVRTRIDWCESCGEGWYISGGVFVGPAAVD